MGEALPEWEEGTVAVLSTIGDEPHAIPVSTAVRAGPRRVLLALALRRRSLALLRARPRAPEVPVRFLFGVHDPALDHRALDGMDAELVHDAGHFVVDERPELVADRALAFFS